MTAAPMTIRRDKSIRTALQMLLKHRLLGLPVVDDEDRYLGMFLRSELVATLLPRIVRLEEELPEVSRLLDVGFMSDTIQEAQERFQAVADRPVSDYLQTETPVLRPDTPVMNAVLFLYRARTYLPVVDEASGKLLGVVSTWDILGKIAGNPV